jgi:hypothetical protein
MKERKRKRKKARPLLLAAAASVTLVFSGCGDDVTGSGNLMASPYDMSATPDQSQPDLAKKD